MKETSIVFCTDKALEPPEPECYCERCGCGIDPWADMAGDGRDLCDLCREYIESDQCVIDYIDAYPDDFIKYLNEYYGDIAELTVAEMIADYRELIGGEITEWAIR